MGVLVQLSTSWTRYGVRSTLVFRALLSNTVYWEIYGGKMLMIVCRGMSSRICLTGYYYVTKYIRLSVARLSLLPLLPSNIPSIQMSGSLPTCSMVFHKMHRRNRLCKIAIGTRYHIQSIFISVSLH